MFPPAARGGQACKRKSDIPNKTLPQLGHVTEGSAQTPVIHLQLPFVPSLEDLSTTLWSLGRPPEVIDTTTPWPYTDSRSQLQSLANSPKQHGSLS